MQGILVELAHGDEVRECFFDKDEDERLAGLSYGFHPIEIPSGLPMVAVFRDGALDGLGVRALRGFEVGTEALPENGRNDVRLGLAFDAVAHPVNGLFRSVVPKKALGLWVLPDCLGHEQGLFVVLLLDDGHSVRDAFFPLSSCLRGEIDVGDGELVGEQLRLKAEKMEHTAEGKGLGFLLVVHALQPRFVKSRTFKQQVDGTFGKSFVGEVCCVSLIHRMASIPYKICGRMQIPSMTAIKMMTAATLARSTFLGRSKDTLACFM